MLTYDAYGNAIDFAPSTAKTDLLYNTESYDARTGLQYLRLRWYDPAIGQFTASDPYAGNIHVPPTLNKYVYCGANPVIWADPTGLLSIGGLFGLVLAKNVITSRGSFTGINMMAGLALGMFAGAYTAFTTDMDAWYLSMGVGTAGLALGIAAASAPFITGATRLAHYSAFLWARRIGFGGTAFMIGFTEGYYVGWAGYWATVRGARS